MIVDYLNFISKKKSQMGAIGDFTEYMRSHIYKKS